MSLHYIKSISLLIKPKCGKIRTRKTPNRNTFCVAQDQWVVEGKIELTKIMLLILLRDFGKALVFSAKLQSFTGYLRLTLVFMWNSALREKFNFSFLVVFKKLSFWQGEWALGYHCMKFRHFSDLILPKILRRLATREVTGIYRVYK